MNPNLELKQYCFSLYWGQKVSLPTKNDVEFSLREINEAIFAFIELKGYVLHLRPLSSITEAEKDQYMKIGNDNMDRFLDGMINTRMKTGQVDYLRQCSIALPIYFKGEHYSVDRLVELDIITLKS